MTVQVRIAVAGAVATLLAGLPLLRLTATHAWVLPTVFAVTAVLGAGLLARRLRAPAWLIAPLQVSLLVLWAGTVVAGDVSALGVLPGTLWLARLQAVVAEGAVAVQTYAPPVPVTPGITLFLLAGIGGLAVVVDLVAVTLRRAAWAGLPLATAYAVPAVLLPGGLHAGWFVPAAAGYLALLVAERRVHVGGWGRSASDASGAPETVSLARGGRRIGAVAVAAAVLVPALVPDLPQGLLGRGPGAGGSGGRTIQTDNPIVDLKRDLTRPDNVEVLRYRSDLPRPGYIRSVTLDVFDGSVWQTSDRRVPESQRVGEGLPDPPGWDGTGGREEAYEFEISDNYRSRWLPLPYPAREVEIDGDWRYDAATLDVVSPDLRTQGMDYRVISLGIDTTAERLRSATAPGNDLDPMLDLPRRVPRSVRDLARQVTRAAGDDFERAVALQSFFRTEGGFVYDLSTVPGNSARALEEFLEERRGYCEQFAASMAIMARSVGIPARVAVGFLPGIRNAEREYVVRAHDAHAWPELYFHTVGWVRFEPTPGARTGAAPAWTVPSRDGGADGGATPEPTASASASPGVNPRAAEGPQDPGAAASDTFAARTLRSWGWAAIAAGGLLALLALPAAVASVRRSWRWRRAGADPRARAEAAWAELRDAARDAGQAWDPADTPRTAGARIAELARLDLVERRRLDSLVGVTERARYAPTVVAPEGLRADTARLRSAVLASATRRRRWRSLLWPTTLRDTVSRSRDAVTDGLAWVDDTSGRVRQRTGELAGRRR